MYFRNQANISSSTALLHGPFRVASRFRERCRTTSNRSFLDNGTPKNFSDYSFFHQSTDTMPRKNDERPLVAVARSFAVSSRRRVMSTLNQALVTPAFEFLQ